MDFGSRQKKLAKGMAAAGVQGLLVTHLPNVRYLCGFTGSAGVLACRKNGKRAFFTDGRYTEQAKHEVEGARVVIAKGSALQEAAGWVSGGRSTPIAVEADHMTLAQRQAVRKALNRPSKLKETAGLVEELRLIKEPEEISRIKAAVELASGLFDGLVATITRGVRESAVAAKLEFGARRAGAEGMSFETIVASGKRSVLPHGVASSVKVGKGFVVLDFGVILAGYCSDMTRTVHVGKAGARARAMYEAVLEAQEAAIAAVQPGKPLAEVDAAARGVLERAGLGKHFTHSTGHGVGLEIHEAPRVARGQKDRLRPGMVITIEPGAYVPGFGGVRIEDIVVVTEGGCQVLTPTGKELIEL